MDDDDQICIAVCGERRYDATAESSFTLTCRVDGVTYQAKIIDTSGRRRSSTILDPATLKADAFLLVYDITSESSLTNLERFTDLIAIETEERLDGGVLPPVTMVVGNKIDLRRGNLSSVQINTTTGMDWARRRGYGFTEVTAKDNSDIERIFTEIVRRVLEGRTRNESNDPESRVQYRTSSGVILSGFAQGVTRPLTPMNEHEIREERRLMARRRRFWRWLCCY